MQTNLNNFLLLLNIYYLFLILFTIYNISNAQFSVINHI